MEKIINSKERGITLIALVITVIILIILATVTLNVVLGEGGLIEKAQLAKDMTLNATAKEEEGLAKLEEEFANIMSEESIKNYEIVIGEESIIYNGKEQKPTITLKEEGNIVPAEEYTVEYTNNINAGTGKITVTINGSGQTVEKEFTIEPKKVTITTMSATKEYNGIPLTNPKYEVKGLINENDLGEIKVTGTQTTIGSSANTVEYTPNSNYIVSEVLGTLTVNPPGSITPGDPDPEEPTPVP